MSFLIYLGTVVCAFLWYSTTLFLPRCSSPQVSKFKVSDFILYLAPLVSIHIVELRNPISDVSRPRFQNLNFPISYNTSVCYLRFTWLSSKIWSHTSSLWAFRITWELLCVPSLDIAQLCFFLYVSHSRFQNLIFLISYHISLSYIQFAWLNSKI